jgi:hypothetical protein
MFPDDKWGCADAPVRRIDKDVATKGLSIVLYEVSSAALCITYTQTQSLSSLVYVVAHTERLNDTL